MKRIRFSATYPTRFQHPLHRAIVEDSPIPRIELLMWSPTADPRTLLWCAGDRDATAAVIQEIDSRLDTELVADGAGTYVFLQQEDYEFPRSLLEVVAGSRVIFMPPVVFREDGTVQFEAVGETAALSSFHDDLDDLANLTIEQVQTFERPHSPSRLTDRQRDALAAAVSVGYYEVPREGTVSDVAGVLDCSTSTAGELVRKAEAAVITHFTEPS